MGDSPAVTRDAFLQLLVIQLKNQDPLEPMSSEQFVEQLAQLQSVQELNDISESMNFLKFLQGSAILGKAVEARWGDGAVVGVVQLVRAGPDGQVIVDLGGLEVDLEDITRILNEIPPELEEPQDAQEGAT